MDVPIKNENNLNRGFAFIEFASKEDAATLVKEMNGKHFKGRIVSVEFSKSKKAYEQKITNMVEHSKLPREELVVPKILKEDKK